MCETVACEKKDVERCEAVEIFAVQNAILRGVSQVNKTGLIKFKLSGASVLEDLSV